MKLGINQATMMKTPMEDFLRAIAKAGFQGVELRRDETFEYLKNHSIADLKKILDETGLDVVSWNAIELFSLCTEGEFLDMYEYSERLMKIGKKIGCDFIIAVPSFKKDAVVPEEKYFELTVERFKILRQLAKKHDFTMGFEPLGFEDCSVRMMDFALKIIEETEKDGLKKSPLVIDTFHYFLAGHSVDALKKIDASRLGLVHFNDSTDKDFGELRDGDRIWPGSGIFKLKAFMETLKEIKYQGYISIELFNKDYWKLTPEECAEKAYESLKNYM